MSQDMFLEPIAVQPLPDGLLDPVARSNLIHWNEPEQPPDNEDPIGLPLNIEQQGDHKPAQNDEQLNPLPASQRDQTFEPGHRTLGDPRDLVEMEEHHPPGQAAFRPSSSLIR